MQYLSIFHTVVFLSTPSARRATCAILVNFSYGGISIHALREEGDQVSVAGEGDLHDFYPRPPRGGRPYPELQSADNYRISIHALREEGDQRSLNDNSVYPNFYPRPPRGGRPATPSRPR